MSREGALLITGATGKLGRAIVPALAAERRCVVLYRDASAWEKLRAAAPASLAGMKGDLNDAAALDRVFRDINPADVLHLAGGWSGGTISETDDQTWLQALEMNLHPAFRLLRASLQHLPSGGSATFISSIGVAELRSGMAAYIVAKSALETLVKLGAKEGASRGLRVNAVAPDTIGDAAGEVRPERVLAAVKQLIGDTGCSGMIVPLGS